MNKIILFLLVTFLSAGCQQVVDLKLNNADAKLIIQGSVNNTAGPYQVTITKSIGFYQDNVYPTVSGALVIITDSTAAVRDTLSEVAPGIYETHFISGHAGNTYLLKVALDGKTYAASSTMPQPVVLDSVTFNYDTKNTIRAVANFQDPAGVSNYYKFSCYTNGKNLNEVHTFEDRLSDGRYIREKMDNDTSDIKKNDYVQLNPICLDKAVYTYMSEAEDIAYNNDNLVAPSTPQTNLTEGALGYFSAETISSRKNEAKGRN